MLTCALGSDYLGVLKSRAAEADADACRASLQSEVSKAERLFLQMDLTRAAAVEALRNEEYQPNQVDKAVYVRSSGRNPGRPTLATAADRPPTERASPPKR